MHGLETRVGPIPVSACRCRIRHQQSSQTAPTEIVTGTGPARVIAFHEALVLLEVGSPGTYRVAIRYAPYWRSSQGCVTRGRDGMLSLHARRAGLASLAFDVDPRRVLTALAGASPPRCPDYTRRP